MTSPTIDEQLWTARVQELCSQIGQPPVTVVFTAPTGTMGRYDDSTDLLELEPAWLALTNGPHAPESSTIIFHELQHRNDRSLLTAARWGANSLYAVGAIMFAGGLSQVMMGSWEGLSGVLRLNICVAITIALLVAASLIRWVMEFRADDFAVDRLGTAAGLATALVPGAKPQRGGPLHPPPAMRIRRQQRRLAKRTQS